MRRVLGTLAILAVPLAAAAQGVPHDAKYRNADEQCSYFFGWATVKDNKDLFPDKVPGWRYTCEHHPDRLRCEDTNDSLQRVIGKRVLNCSQAGK